MMGRIMRKLLQQQLGISLPELLVAVAVIGLIMAGVFGVLSTSVKSFQHTADQGANVQLARNALNEISNELRNATLVSSPVFTSGTDVAGSTVEYTFPDVATPNRRITMGTGQDANSIVVVNRADNSVIRRFGQGRIKAATLEFKRSGADRRVFAVTIIFQSAAYGGNNATPVTTVITTLNSDT